MSLENAVRLLAGTLVTVGVLLTYFFSPYWLLLPLFVGLNLIQSAFTKFCPAEIVMRRLGVGAKADNPHPAGHAAAMNR